MHEQLEIHMFRIPFRLLETPKNKVDPASKSGTSGKNATKYEQHQQVR